MKSNKVNLKKQDREDIENHPFVVGVNDTFNEEINSVDELLADSLFDERYAEFEADYKKQDSLVEFNTYSNNLPTPKVLSSDKRYELFKNARKGDVSSLNELFNQYGKKIMNIVTPYVQENPEMWKEIVEGAYLGFRSGINAISIKENNIIESMKKNVNNGIKKAVKEVIEFNKCCGKYVSIDYNIANSARFDNKPIVEELSVILTEEQKQVVGLSHDLFGYEGPKTPEEVTKELGISQDTFRCIYSMGMYKIHKELGNQSKNNI
ncbi:MAG: hypothetical protein AB7V77_04015 [Candidatus Woesearchaeota archaeon]